MPSINKRVAQQLLNGVSLKNKTYNKEKKTTKQKNHNDTYFTTNMLHVRQIQFLTLLSESQSEEKKCLSQEEKREGTDAACSLAQCIALDKVWKENPVAPFLPHQDKMCKQLSSLPHLEANKTTVNAYSIIICLTVKCTDLASPSNWIF